ncbi:GNAT family N-acetyltransferase [Paenibacillus paeoniae]|uniref:GNAT family N-acetyltransferase n=1 Tax=Paenibacillus paeoniae TaxID=2292705 RepID=A0A371PH68_9BACL|nr:GNAT family N-acetyltransferase [Paenibacillus paeoniae]REK75586.1 GNAT family N-acetyltransferase [Paenibacillus paeoniae]
MLQLNITRINPNVTARLAFEADESHICELMLSVASWLRSKGSGQWGKLLDGHDDHDLNGAIKRGEVVLFIADDVQDLAGAIILQQQPSEWDRRLWGMELKDTAVYLHRLTVNRRYAGQGLGKDIMDWVESGMGYANKDRIRLDCFASSDKLNAFYTECGYAYRGETNGYSLYEKMLTSRSE